MIDNVSAAQANTNAPVYASESKSSMGKDAFLNLMIAQLKNQNPLEPMDGSDYSAQLAQFSSLEQLQNINQSLNTSIDANYLLAQSVNNTMTAALIGKNAKIAKDTITFDGQKGNDIGYTLPAQASKVEVKIYDEGGRLVKTYKDLDTGKGEYKLSWDFLDDNGRKVNSGEYRFEVKAKAMDGSDMTAAQYLIGNIDGVRYSKDGTSILINGVEYQVSDVFEILENNNDTTTNEEG